VHGREHGDLAGAQLDDFPDLDGLVAQPGLFRAGYLGEIRPDIAVEKVFLQHLDRRPRGIDRDRLRPQRADRVQEESDRIDVVEVRMGDEDMVDHRQLGECKVADAGASVDQDVLVDQE
jgi:hypothetical protein